MIYVLFFRSDGGTLESAFRILKGLNSNTFNYLNRPEVKAHLQVDKNVPELDFSQTHTMGFYSDCVRLNRPCLIRGGAKDWPAVSEWGMSAESMSKAVPADT
mmetsp:Transcript_11570/g.17471  ORF Transcript_11570/g.17471 Transcript_11570/m.17471 type:complete len:102 (+) Transcript_11570:115-420(+)